MNKLKLNNYIELFLLKKSEARSIEISVICCLSV